MNYSITAFNVSLNDFSVIYHNILTYHTNHETLTIYSLSHFHGSDVLCHDLAGYNMIGQDRR